MLAKVRITTVLIFLIPLLAFLQGCGSNSSNVDSAGGGDNLNISLTSATGATTLLADGTDAVQMQMTVTNQAGQPLANTPVTFSTTAGQLRAVPDTNVISVNSADPSVQTNQVDSSGTIVVNTNAQGIALVQLVASNTVGSATVTAEVEGFRQTFTVNFISGIPNQLELTVTPSAVSTGGTATIEAIVTDSDNEPLVGVDVTFSLAANDSGASISPTTRITDGNGSAKVTYRAGATPGTDAIQAQLSATTLGNGETLAKSIEVSVQSSQVTAQSLQLLVDSPQMDSDGSEIVTLTALVRDNNNNLVSGVDVTFTADSGGIQVINGTTDAAGTATAQLTTAGNTANRTIEVKAIVTGLTEAVNFVNVSGTTLTLNGPNTLSQGGDTTISLLLQDAGGNGIPNECIAITSGQNNTFSSPAAVSSPDCDGTGQATDFKLKTDFNGQATLDVTVNAGGEHIITATALEHTDSAENKTTVSGTLTLTVSSDNFRFVTPVVNEATDEVEEIFLNTNQDITIRWEDENGVQANQPVNFSTTRGTLIDPADPLNTGSAIQVNTNNSGNATVQITSDNAGTAVITASTTTDGPSNQLELEFVADDPETLFAQVNPTSIGVNTAGNTDQQSVVTVIVRDANSNPVKNQTVIFTLDDVSGGSIFPASATTDSFGRASTVYTAGLVTSAKDGVEIVARVKDEPCDLDNPVSTGPCDSVTLTVAQQELFIKLGTSEVIQKPNDIQYAKPYSVLVTDANGNPVAGATVSLSIIPTQYDKGFFGQVFDAGGTFITWSKFGASGQTLHPLTCANEDENLNGILDIPPDVDANDNDTLEPGVVATVNPSSVTTDATGFATFDVIYAREFQSWVQVNLEARRAVAGSESFSQVTFWLPASAGDFDDEDVAPPGATSPFGTATICSNPN